MSNLISGPQRQVLVDLLRAAFPHDSFPDGPYDRTAQAVLDRAATDPRLQALLVQGLTDVADRRPLGTGPASVLREVTGTPFLAAVVDVAVVALYDDHEVWELLGYEGPSYAQGGYVDRGFDDLDWLPDPRIEEVSA